MESEGVLDESRGGALRRAVEYRLWVGSHRRRGYHDSPIRGGSGCRDNGMVPYINKGMANRHRSQCVMCYRFGATDHDQEISSLVTLRKKVVTDGAASENGN